MIQSLGGVWCTEWRALNARGTVGGIVVFWNSKVLHLVKVEEGSFSVSCRFRNCDDNLLWCFTRVYGSTSKKEREGLWIELGAIRGLWIDPWCVADDFNVSRFNEERSGGSRLTGGMSWSLEIYLYRGSLHLEWRFEQSFKV